MNRVSVIVQTAPSREYPFALIAMEDLRVRYPVDLVEVVDVALLGVQHLGAPLTRVHRAHVALQLGGRLEPPAAAGAGQPDPGTHVPGDDDRLLALRPGTVVGAGGSVSWSRFL